MLMTELINKKRDGIELSKDEIEFMISGYTSGEIPDYQMSAMCMAIVFNGMTDNEILELTLAMEHSGDVIDLSGVNGITADKHSTGGVGDKTSLVLCPMVAACGLKIAKMSGRGLGHTGGTLDKLESFDGFNCYLSEEEFINNVNNVGISIVGQTADIDPADKKLYALRDVTGTVQSIPLIVSSIMSKKLAAGADIIVLDVKCGDGAFMKTIEQATELANKMTAIGKLAGRKCAAVITDMDQPLGYAVGNALEVKEAISVLSGEMRGDLYDLCMTIGSQMLVLGNVSDSIESAKEMLAEAVESGKALDKLADMVEAQGGNREAVYDVSLLPSATIELPVIAVKDGYIGRIHTEKIGLESMELGGGRKTKDDIIDLSVGIVLNKKVGDEVKQGDILATVYGNNADQATKTVKSIVKCFEISKLKVEKPVFIKDIIMP